MPGWISVSVSALLSSWIGLALSDTRHSKNGHRSLENFELSIKRREAEREGRCLWAWGIYSPCVLHSSRSMLCVLPLSSCPLAPPVCSTHSVICVISITLRHTPSAESCNGAIDTLTSITDYLIWASPPHHIIRPHVFQTQHAPQVQRADEAISSSGCFGKCSDSQSFHHIPPPTPHIIPPLVLFPYPCLSCISTLPPPPPRQSQLPIFLLLCPLRRSDWGIEEIQLATCLPGTCSTCPHGMLCPVWLSSLSDYCDSCVFTRTFDHRGGHRCCLGGGGSFLRDPPSFFSFFPGLFRGPPGCHPHGVTVTALILLYSTPLMSHF